MGVLTETMMRLRGEIGAWRHERVVLQHAAVCTALGVEML
jgi:hypothetical protein